MFRKLFSKSRASSVATAQTGDSTVSIGGTYLFRPSVPRRVKGEEMSPFHSPFVITGDLEALEGLPVEMQRLWERVCEDLVGRKGTGEIACQVKLAERVGLFAGVQRYLRDVDLVPSDFVQVFLITLKEFVSGIRTTPPERFSQAAVECKGLFDFLQYCVLHERSRFLLSQDFLHWLLGHYSSLVSDLSALLKSSAAIDNLKIFFSESQGVYAIGELLFTHESDYAYIPELRGKFIRVIKDAIVRINSDESLLALAQTQLAFLAMDARVAVGLKQREASYLDLSLVLLMNLYALAKTFACLPDICRDVLPSQLLAIHQTFLRYTHSETTHLTELFSLFDKHLTVIHFLLTFSLQHKSACLKFLHEHKDIVREVSMHCCLAFVKWENMGYRESFREDQGRLGVMYQMLQSMFGSFLGTIEETMIIQFFAWLPDVFESEKNEGREERWGAIRLYTLELVWECIKDMEDSKMLKFAFESNLLAMIMTPYFFLDPKKFQYGPELGNSYLNQIFELVLLQMEGKTLFLQEFNKSCNQFIFDTPFVSALNKFFTEMILNETIKWLPVINQMQIADYLFQIVADSKRRKESIESITALQETIVTILTIPQIASNMLQQEKSVCKRLVNLMKTEHCDNFCVEMWSRLLGSNASIITFKQFSRLLWKQTDENTCLLLLKSIEKSLCKEGDYEEKRNQTRIMMIASSMLSVAIHLFERFRSFAFWSSALPTLRAMLQNNEPAKIEFNKIGLTGLKSSLLNIFDSCQRISTFKNEIKVIVENLIFIIFNVSSFDTYLDVFIPNLSDILVYTLIRSSDETIQLQYIDLLSIAICENTTNALKLSLSGLLKPVFRFFSITHNGDLKRKLISMMLAMAKEHFSPEDLCCLISLINDDTKASYPSDITTNLLEVVSKAFEGREKPGMENIFRFNCGGRIDCGLTFPKKHGFTIILWVKLEMNSTLVTMWSNDRSKLLSVTVWKSGSIDVKYSVDGMYLYHCSAKGDFFEQSVMISLSFQPSTPLKKINELSIFLNAEKLKIDLNEGKLKLKDDVFQWLTIGSEIEGQDFAGILACSSLFLTNLSPEQLKEIYNVGPSFTGNFLDGHYDFRHGPELITFPALKDALPELAFFLHPAYCTDEKRSENVISRWYGSKALDSSRGATFFSLQKSDLQQVIPQLHNVLVENAIHVANSLGVVGLKVLLPLLKRIEKRQHLKVILHQILDILSKAVKSSCSLRWIKDELLIETLRILFEKLSKKSPFKTSTAILIMEFKESLYWSKSHQMHAVESLILNPTIWSRSKKPVQNIMLSVNHESIYTTPSEKVRLVSKIIRFCLVAFPEGENFTPTCDQLAFLKKAGELIRTLTGDDVTAAVIDELLENIIEYEDFQINIVHMLLKLLSFFAKRGKTKATDKFLHVLFYLLHQDSNRNRDYTLRVLHILKMTLIEDTGMGGKNVGKRAIDTVFAFMNNQLKNRLSSAEYQAVLSLMLQVPEIIEKRTRSYPELPYKDGYKVMIGDYKEVSIRFPQAIEIVTSRMQYSITCEILNDLQLLAEHHINDVYSQKSFPDWLTSLLNDPNRCEEDDLIIGLQRFSAVVFGQALIRVTKPVKKLRKFMFGLLSNRHRSKLVSSLLLLLMDFLLSSHPKLNNTDVLQGNLQYFAYLFEDIISYLKANRINFDPHLSIRFVEIMKVSRLITNSNPIFPMKSICDLKNQYKFEDSETQRENRKGGIMRIALKTVFQSFRTASESAMEKLFPVMRLFLKPFRKTKQESTLLTDSESLNRDKMIYEFMRATTIVSQKPFGVDIFSDPNFVSLLLFSEICDLMIHRRSEPTIVRILANTLTKLNSYSSIIESIENLAMNLTMDDQFDVEQFTLKYGVISLGSAPVLIDDIQKVRFRSETWWKRDSFEIAKVKLYEKLTQELKPAFASNALDRVILSQDWVESVHPFFVISSSCLIGSVEAIADLALDNGIEKANDVTCSDAIMSDILTRVDDIKNYRMKGSLDGDFLYAKTKWREYYKWQTREAGLWLKETPTDFVWKLDPEFDLEYKCTRMKLMLGRKQSYYNDKANKKTLANIADHREFKRQCSPERGEIQGMVRKNCMTVVVLREMRVDFMDLLLSKSAMTAPSEEFPSKSLSDSSFLQKRLIINNYECERIQPKGSSLGSLEVTPKYLIFISSQSRKGNDEKYFASASVKVHSEMHRNHSQKDHCTQNDGHNGNIS